MSLLGLILLSLGLGLAAWLGFYWSVKSGQYDDPEGPKYRMLDDEEEDSSTPSPRRGEGRGEGTAPSTPASSTPSPRRGEGRGEGTAPSTPAPPRTKK